MAKTYNAVYSVKGGCGKTAVSIFLANYLAQNNNANDTGKKVCLVDADILGSSMLNTFIQVKDEKELTEDRLKGLVSNHRFINDIVTPIQRIPADYRDYLFNLAFIKSLQETTSTTKEDIPEENENDFNIVFASPRTEDIGKYRLNADNSFVPEILHSTFRTSFCSLINDKVCFKDTDDFVFDLPPSPDGFSDVVFDCIFGRDNKKEKVGKEDDIRNLFYVLSLDSGHLLTTKREIERITKKSEMAFPGNLFFVINDVNHFEKFYDIANDRKAILTNAIKTINALEGEWKRVHFIYFSFSEKYFKAVTIDNGLAGQRFSDLFSDITKIYNLDDENEYTNLLYRVCWSIDPADQQPQSKIVFCFYYCNHSFYPNNCAKNTVSDLVFYVQNEYIHAYH